MGVYNKNIKALLLETQSFFYEESQALVIDSWGSSGHISEEECDKLYEEGMRFKQQADDIQAYLEVNNLVDSKPNIRYEKDVSVYNNNNNNNLNEPLLVGDNLPF